MNGLPLYRLPGDRLPERSADGNAGLWYDKFCHLWETEEKPGRGTVIAVDKTQWIQTVTGKPMGDAALLVEHARRLETMARARGGACVDLVCAERMVSGLGRAHPVQNGFAWHHALGVPYLGGSGLKGLVRAWAKDWAADAAPQENIPQDDIPRIFGPPPPQGRAGSGESGLAVGSVVVLDALPVGPVFLEADVMTPHYTAWYQEGQWPGDWHDPVPVPFLTVAPGAVFRFAVMPRCPGGTADEDARRVLACLTRALDVLGAGAKTAAGYGRFSDKATLDKALAAKSAPGWPRVAPPRSGHRVFWRGQEVEITEKGAVFITIKLRDGTVKRVPPNDLDFDDECDE